jgi:protein gp37
MKTNIGWATHSLNFYNWYCTKVSAGCKNCYMFDMRKQFGRQPESLQWRDQAVTEWKKLKPGAIVFVNSMSDTYHEDADPAWVARIHSMINSKLDVTFMLLTKRPMTAWSLATWLLWPDNLWLGVTVENRESLDRIDILKDIPAKHKFVSAEPLLEDISQELKLGHMKTVDWMIVGGESGNNRRKFDKQWARDLRDFCKMFDVHFTFKQGSHRLPGKDYELDGQYYLDTPMMAVKDKS